MATSKVLLVKPLENLGGEGEQVSVKAGYARNFLFPQKIAIPVTKANKKQIEALQKARGRLFPFGWWHLLRARNDFSVVDLMINGAVPEWQNKGVSSIYYQKMAEKAIQYNYGDSISNPQIESNSAANIWNAYPGHTLYMRRRCYIKDIR